MANSNVNKGDLVKHLASSVDDLTQVKAAKVVDAVFDFIADCLGRGDDFGLIGFGSFTTVVRKARSGRNPQTGAVINIPKSRVVKFKVGKNLKDKVADK